MSDHRDTDMQREDDLLSGLASDYVEEYGRQLQAEMARLEGEDIPVSPEFDRRVREKVLGPQEPKAAPRRRPRVLRYAALAAAIVLLATVLPRMLDLGEQQADELPPVLEEPWGEQGPQDAEGPDEDMEEAPWEEGPSADGEIIPLGFTVPDSFSVEDVLLDNGQTVYYLADDYRDDVVVTLEYGGDYGAYLDLDEIQVGDSSVRGVWRTDYSVVAFEQEDILYVLTCSYDINTLLGLTEVIVA